MGKFGSNTVFSKAQEYMTEDTYQQSSAIGVGLKTLILTGITFLSAVIGHHANLEEGPNCMGTYPKKIVIFYAM